MVDFYTFYFSYAMPKKVVIKVDTEVVAAMAAVVVVAAVVEAV